MTQGGELGSLFVLMSLAIVTTRREKREGFCTLCFCPPPPPTKMLHLKRSIFFALNYSFFPNKMLDMVSGRTVKKNKTYVFVSIVMFPQRSS